MSVALAEIEGVRIMELNKSGQDYLEAILIVGNQRGVVREIDLVNRLGYAKPSVSIAVRKLRNGGFLSMGDDKLIHLTDAGREIAEKMYARHCFFTTLFIALGIEPTQAEKEACEIEHDVSDETFDRIQARYALCNAYCEEVKFHAG